MIVFVTLFVCGGTYPATDVQAWTRMFASEQTAIIIVGKCTVFAPNTTIFRVIGSRASVGNARKKYEHLHNKFEIWKLPYPRVAYYDLDVVVKPPVARCAHMCSADMCAVRDPVATWPHKVKTYFNGGFFVATPSRAEYRGLRARGADGRTFAEQDVLNDHFAGRWQKLPKECNWLHYAENRRTALTDEEVMMVHLRGQVVT